VFLDLHFHSNGSYDSLITPKQVDIYAEKKGLDTIFITDHNKISQALRIQESSKKK